MTVETGREAMKRDKIYLVGRRGGETKKVSTTETSAMKKQQTCW